MTDIVYTMTDLYNPKVSLDKDYILLFVQRKALSLRDEDKGKYSLTKRLIIKHFLHFT